MASTSSAPTVAPAWRLAIFIIATTVGVLGAGLVLSPSLGLLGKVTGLPLATWSFVWSLAIGLVVGHAWTIRVAEPRGWTFVSLGRAALRWRAIVPGVALGAAAIVVPTLALLALGWLRLERAPAGNGISAALGLLPALIPAAIWEELALRGYFFATAREAWGAPRAIITTSLVFGALHLQNAQATWLSALLVALAGVFLGLLLVKTRSLYAVWAAHLSWNFAMAALLHAPVSGIDMALPNYRLVDAGPDWATGGPWGPEGGVFAGAALLVTIVLLARWPVGRQENRE